MTLFLILFLLLLLLPDLYIWLTFVRGNTALLWNIVYWLPTAAALASIGLWMLGGHQEWLIRLFFGLLLCVSAPKLCFTLVSLMGRGIGLAVPHARIPGMDAPLVAMAATRALVVAAGGQGRHPGPGALLCVAGAFERTGALHLFAVLRR